MKTLLTPRTIAWILVIVGIAYFIYISPKTPIEFFDADARDEAAIRQLEGEKNKITDRTGVAASRNMNELMSYKRQMDRIAILYDMTHNPQRVNSSQSWIVEGLYFTDESTEAILRANNEVYRATEQKLQRCRKEVQSAKRGRGAGAAKNTSADEKIFEAAVFRMRLEMLLLRQFQARLFWRNAH
jgi:hypothetical protein